jgi:hypothetical protein
MQCAYLHLKLGNYGFDEIVFGDDVQAATHFNVVSYSFSKFEFSVSILQCSIVRELEQSRNLFSNIAIIHLLVCHV